MNETMPQTDETLKSEELSPESPNHLADPLDGFNWNVIVNDIYTLWTYSKAPSNDQARDEAVKAVVSSYRRQFMNRLGQELKARNTRQWKEETFARLKAEFEQEGE